MKNYPGMHPKNRYPDQEHVIRDDGSLDVGSVNNEPTMAQQHTKDECDINNIMKKYETTGQFQCHIKEGGAYQDFTQITDFHEMANTVAYANSAFSSLPAHIRAKFRNDPGNLLEFLQDERNYDEGVSLGLLNPRKAVDPIKASKNDDSNDDKNGKKSKVKTAPANESDS